MTNQVTFGDDKLASIHKDMGSVDGAESAEVRADFISAVERNNGGRRPGGDPCGSRIRGTSQATVLTRIGLMAEP